jgi:hypothetical protein
MHIDKNIKDLINVCHTFEIKPPTREQMTYIVKDLFPEITTNPTDCNELVEYIGEDLSKLSLTQEYYCDNSLQLLEDIRSIFIKKSQNVDRTQKIQQLYSADIPLKLHSQFINETDRTTVSLLWHENVIDILKAFTVTNSSDKSNIDMSISTNPVITQPTKKSKKNVSSATPKRKTSSKKSVELSETAVTATPAQQPPPPQPQMESLSILRKTLPIYVRMLDNICYSDYIDRITFQKQVWKLNEISSIMKTFKNNHILHLEMSINQNLEQILPKEIRFTKILTKYSSEYNNFWFIRNICQTLGIDKNDLLEKSIKYSNDPATSGLLDLFEANEFDMTTLNRLIKYYKVYSTGLLNAALEVPCSDIVVPEMEMMDIL